MTMEGTDICRLRRAKRGELSSEGAGINGTGWRRTRGPFADVGSRRSPVVCSSRARGCSWPLTLCWRGEVNENPQSLCWVPCQETRRDDGRPLEIFLQPGPVRYSPGRKGWGEAREFMCWLDLWFQRRVWASLAVTIVGCGRAEVTDPVRLRPPSPSPRAPPAPSRFAAEGVCERERVCVTQSCGQITGIFVLIQPGPSHRPRRRLVVSLLLLSFLCLPLPSHLQSLGHLHLGLIEVPGRVTSPQQRDWPASTTTPPSSRVSNVPRSVLAIPYRAPASQRLNQRREGTAAPLRCGPIHWDYQSSTTEAVVSVLGIRNSGENNKTTTVFNVST